MNTVTFQKTKAPTWSTASGEAVPMSFLKKSDKVKEVYAAKIFKAAINAETTLLSLHNMMKEAFAEIDKLIKAEYNIRYDKTKKEGKGSLTWYNFDKSLKVEADINDIVKWDDALMTEAHNCFKAYINANLTEANELIAALVNSAFANTKGMIDTKKVFQILKYQDKIKSAKFQKACELIKQAQGIDSTKLYMRVWAKEEDGQYRNINLNFSNI